MQNIENEQWDEEEVNAKLLRKMTRATDSVLDTRERVNSTLPEIGMAREELGRGNDPLEMIDLRTAAYILAVKRVADVTLRRGIWP